MTTFYLSPFRKFELPKDKELLDSWKAHYRELNIRTRVVGMNPKAKELLVNEEDHERELARI